MLKQAQSDRFIPDDVANDGAKIWTHLCETWKYLLPVLSIYTQYQLW